MRVNERRIWVALAIAVSIWGIIGGIVFAATFSRVADNAGTGGITNGSYDRAVACRTDECFVFGGGSGVSITYSDELYRYVPSTDTWSLADTSTIGGGGVSERSFGGNDDFMAMFAIPNGGTSAGCILQIVNLNTFTWSNAGFPSDPDLATRCAGGSAGTVAGDYLYFTAAGGGQIFFFRILLSNPSTFETLMDWPQTCSSGGNNLDNILVWDENVNELILFHTHDGCVSTYDLDTEIWDDKGMIFDPCISGGYCIPTLGFFDLDNGVSAGVLDTGANTIPLYAYDPVAESFSAVEILADADLDYAPLNGVDGCCLRAGWWHTNNETNVLMGSATATTPSVIATRWWSFTGDPVPFTPTEKNFDSWVTNFLASMGMNSPVGKILIGSLFAGVLYFVLAIKGVPWIMALGVAGFAVVTMTAVMIFDPAILLGLIAIIGIGAIGLIFALFSGGGERN